MKICSIFIVFPTSFYIEKSFVGEKKQLTFVAWNRERKKTPFACNTQFFLLMLRHKSLSFEQHVVSQQIGVNSWCTLQFNNSFYRCINTKSRNNNTPAHTLFLQRLPFGLSSTLYVYRKFPFTALNSLERKRQKVVIKTFYGLILICCFSWCCPLLNDITVHATHARTHARTLHTMRTRTKEFNKNLFQCRKFNSRKKQQQKRKLLQPFNNAKYYGEL